MIKRVNKEKTKEIYSSYPLISVIVPVYNAERYIEKCVHSIVNQTFLSWELILVDDGSLDNSGVICDNLARSDARIRVIHKKNGGVSSARNIGINLCKGRYVTFIDSDDWVTDTYLKDFGVEFLTEQDINRGILISQGIRQFYPEKGFSLEMFKYESVEFSIRDNPKSLLKYNILANGCPVAKIFDLEIIRKYELLFNENISLNEDHLFVLDYLCYVDKIFLIDSINYIYLYDFKVPSLTKINHTSCDSFNAAIALQSSFEKFKSIHSLNRDEFASYDIIFGPMQLIRASLATFKEEYSFLNFKNIALQYKRSIPRNYKAKYVDVYSKLYAYLIYRVDMKVFYIIQYFCYIINRGYYCIKLYIKRLRLKF